MFYQCMMDGSQLVKIVSVEGSTTHVRVYYKEKDLTKDPRFVGFATRPTSLFHNDDALARRIGYFPWNREEEIDRIQRAEAAAAAKLKARREARRGREEEYEDDYDY